MNNHEKHLIEENFLKSITSFLRDPLGKENIGGGPNDPPATQQAARNAQQAKKAAEEERGEKPLNNPLRTRTARPMPPITPVTSNKVNLQAPVHDSTKHNKKNLRDLFETKFLNYLMENPMTGGFNAHINPPEQSDEYPIKSTKCPHCGEHTEEMQGLHPTIRYCNTCNDQVDVE